MRRRDLAALAAVALCLLVPLGYLLVRALDGAGRLVDRDIVGLGESGDTYAALPWIAIAAAAALAALAGWYITLRRDDEDRGTAAEHEKVIERLHRAHQQEREWSRRLGEKLSDLHRTQGALGGRDDVRTLVLRVAIELLGAEKGLLLSRDDADGDGNLDVVAAEGFENEPARSELVQRFGGEVIEKDTIVRIGGGDLPDVDGAPADDEIDSLVAIPIYIRDDFHGAVVCANGEVLHHEDEVLVALGDHAGAILENSQLHGTLRSSYIATVKMLADAIEVKDPFLRGHSDEVSGLTQAMARRLEFKGERREQLIFGSLLHDIGKIGVSERILLKPGPLTDEEFAEVKLHPRIGFKLVSQLPLLRAVAPAILHHHEQFDGSGYPSGLSGEAIPLEARVIAIIDAFSAMISDRPYQAAVPVEAALAELERCAGSHFDPRLVEIFVEEVEAGVPDDGEHVEPLAATLDDPELNSLRDAIPHLTLDPQTLLLSHGAFRERLTDEVVKARAAGPGAQALAVVAIRVENLRELNESVGYRAADALLEELGHTVERIAAEHGAKAGRDGGAVVAIAGPIGSPEIVAQAVRELAPGGLTLRIGSARWNEALSAEDLLALASAG